MYTGLFFDAYVCFWKYIGLQVSFYIENLFFLHREVCVDSAATQEMCCNTRYVLQHWTYAATQDMCCNTRNKQCVATHEMCCNTRNVLQNNISAATQEMGCNT